MTLLYKHDEAVEHPASRHAIRIQAIFWGAFFIVTIILLRLLGPVMAPFVTGLAIAYMLNPLATSLGQKMPRGLAAVAVLLSFLLLVTLFIVLLSPLIAKQATELIANIPEYIERFKAALNDYILRFNQLLGDEDVQKIRDAAGTQVGTVLKGATGVLFGVWSGGMALIDIATFLVITPVVAFYCLRDWPLLTKKVEDLFPLDMADTLRAMFREFDMRLSGFVRGQLLVCLCLGAIYGISLTLIGLNFGLAIGLLAGLLSFIPYVGSTFGFVASVGVALVQYEGYKMPLVVIAIFLVGQFIEGNFLTPKLVGERIGLHAVWVIFALMAGGSLFGFTGLLLAVPVAALLGVVVRYGIVWYKQSPAYRGEHPSIL